MPHPNLHLPACAATCRQLGRRQRTVVDRFFQQLENKHFQAVDDVLSSIINVQRSIRSVLDQNCSWYH